MRTVKAIMDEYGHIELLEPVTLDTKRQVLVTILENNHPQASLLEFLDDLASFPLSERNPKEIEADIQAERNAWDE